MTASYFSARHFIYFGSCVAICAVQSIQGPILVSAGTKIPDTAEIEALGWILEKELPSEYKTFEEAASNADTDSRKAILARIVFPLLESLSRRHGQSLGIQEEETDKLKSYIRCMEALTFTPKKGSFRTNEAEIMLPDGWEKFEDGLRVALSKYEKEGTEREDSYHQDTVSSEGTGIVQLSRQRDGGV